MEKEIERKFEDIFGKKGFFSTKAPGRVNLIGEHIDYQGGNVLPIAIDRYVWSSGRKGKSGKIKIYSYNYSDYIEVPIKKITYQKEKLWANYVLGVIKEFIDREFKIEGVEIVFGGNVPSGSGLSSSAAVEISISSLIMKIFDINLPPLEVVKLSKKAENDFVGVSCGIMDQFSSYLSKKNYALLIDCKTLNYSYIPLKLRDYKMLLVDTKKRKTSSLFSL